MLVYAGNAPLIPAYLLSLFIQVQTAVGFPTNLESKDKHVGRLREIIQQYTTDEGLRREVKFLSAERFPR